MLQKKFHMKLFICLLSFVIVITSSSPVFATDNTESSASREEMIDLLVENGSKRETADALDDTQLEELYTALQNGETVDIANGVVEVDNLEELEAFVNAEEEELLDAGYTESQIEDAEETVEEIFEMDDEELSEEMGMSEVEIELIRDIEEGVSEETEEENLDVKASGTISSSKMSFSFYKRDWSSKTKPKYKFTTSFYWKTLPLFSKTDYIAMAWGGGLNVTEETGSVRYWSHTSGFYAASKFSRSMSIEEVVQKGLKFSFPFGKNGCKVRAGATSCILSQTKFKGYETNVLAQYGHRKVKINSSVNVSVGTTGTSGGASISFASAFDESPQKKFTIRY